MERKMAGFTTELFRRRIPQILGAYLIASWAVLEFADWAVNRERKPAMARTAQAAMEATGDWVPPGHQATVD